MLLHDDQPAPRALLHTLFVAITGNRYQLPVSFYSAYCHATHFYFGRYCICGVQGAQSNTAQREKPITAAAALAAECSTTDHAVPGLLPTQELPAAGQDLTSELYSPVSSLLGLILAPLQWARCYLPQQNIRAAPVLMQLSIRHLHKAMQRPAATVTGRFCQVHECIGSVIMHCSSSNSCCGKVCSWWCCDGTRHFPGG